jgi:hypothetical protein
MVRKDFRHILRSDGGGPSLKQITHCALVRLGHGISRSLCFPIPFLLIVNMLLGCVLEVR